MKTLVRQSKRNHFKLLKSLITRTLFCGMLAFYLSYVAQLPFSTQLAYIVGICVLSLLIDYFAAKPAQNIEVKLEEQTLFLLGVKIKINEINEMLYAQSKRFEHSLRLCYKNQSYQDFEFASQDLIDDLRLYYFLLDNQLPIKMLDDNKRFIAQ